MKVFLRYTYRLGKADTTGVVLRRALDTLGSEPLVEFLFAGKGLDRILKRFPDLGAFNRGSIVNLDWRFHDRAPGTSIGRCGVATLSEIADGIPKRFPCDSATFFFPEVPWAGIRIPPQPVGSTGTWSGIHPETIQEPVPGIVISSHWWVRRRDIKLRATVPLEAPTDGTVALQPAEETLRHLTALGAFGPPKVILRLDPEEQPSAEHTQRLQSIVEGWDSTLSATLFQLPLPHELPVDPGSSSDGSGLTSPHKAALVATLRPRGWKYVSSESGSGVFVLSKQSPRGNKIRLCFDVGSWSHFCTCTLKVQGPGWQARFTIDFVRGGKMRQYRVVDDAAWTKIVENIALVVHHLERTALAEVDALSSPAPPWFAALA